MPRAIAYLPLATHPEAAPDAAVRAAAGLASAQGLAIEATVLAVDVPPVPPFFGAAALGVEGMARAVEDRSRQEAQRLQALVEGLAGPGSAPAVTLRTVPMGSEASAAAVEGRYRDAVVLPWSGETAGVRDLAEALVFEAGVPVILVPPGAPAQPVDHVAIGWDGSRVAARALGDALRLFSGIGRISVLTVRDEKPLAAPDLAQRLAAALERRGLAAAAIAVPLAGRPVAAALQDAAAAGGAQVLAMGGFGHARLRDFVLGGATRGVLADLRMAVLLSH